MKFGIEKCAMITIKSGKRKGIEQLNQEKIRTFGKIGNYKYLGTMEVDTIKQR